MKTGKALAILAALALVPLLPYAIWGYAGQDFEFHATAWLGMRDAWRAGSWAPMWDGRANFGMGDPHLGLYPPGAMVAGGLLAMLLPLRYVPALFVWLAVAGGGAAMYFASREFVAERDRLPAAALYMLSPYLITTALVRFAAGELLVQALLPLILLYFYRAAWRRDRRAVLLLALLLGAAWFTNVPESVVLFYCLGFVALFCAWRQRTAWPVARVALAQLLALSLAAFYLAPLWRERAWIYQGRLIRLDPRGLLLFMPYRGMGVETQKIFKYSCWLFACAGLLLLLGCLRRRSRPLLEDAATLTWTSLAGLAFCFQLPLALPAWRHLPELALVAFPFRFLPLPGAALPLVLLAPATRRTWRVPVYAAVALMTLLPLLEHARLQRTASTRVPAFAVLVAGWHDVGYAGMPEFVPPGVTRPSSRRDTALPAIRSDSSRCFQAGSEGYLYFFTDSAIPCALRPGLYFYPYWKASEEHGVSLPVSSDRDHLLVVMVPPGKHQVELAFAPHSMTRTVSRWFSLALLSVIVCGLFWKRLRS